MPPELPLPFDPAPFTSPPAGYLASESIERLEQAWLAWRKNREQLPPDLMDFLQEEPSIRDRVLPPLAEVHFEYGLDDGQWGRVEGSRLSFDGQPQDLVGERCASRQNIGSVAPVRGRASSMRTEGRCGSHSVGARLPQGQPGLDFQHGRKTTRTRGARGTGEARTTRRVAG